jgi:ribosomal protein S18 acetylase RimI-like enzyme
MRRREFGRRFARSRPAAARYGSWVAVTTLHGNYVGYAWVVPMVGDDDACYLEEIVVTPDHRDRGLGTRLVREAATWMSEQGFVTMATASLGDIRKERREAWFVALGFRARTGGMYMAPVDDIGAALDGRWAAFR